MKLYFDDEGFDAQLQRTVGKCDAGMASVGECLYIASRIQAGDRDSWYVAWSTFADGLAGQAAAAKLAGHTISAASLRLRAAEYYRQAFFWHRDNLDAKELNCAYRASVDAFRSALPDLPHPGRVLEGETPGYLFAPPGVGPFPTILHIGGYDSTAEELYASAHLAIDRGWAFVCLDGPGQGSVLYDRRVPLRPDWEHVLPGMFDLIAGLPEVDARRIVLIGRSFGGLLAPRGAAGEPRLAALIVDPGQYDGSPPWQALAVRRRSSRQGAIRRTARNSGIADVARTAHGDEWRRRSSGLLSGYAPLYQHRTSPIDQVRKLRHRQRDRPRLDRSGPAALRRNDMCEDIP